MFGGIQCKFNWDGNSKICSIQTTGQKALTPWLNDQCGQGCRYDDLSYLDLDQVGGLAHTGSGCRFKVMKIINVPLSHLLYVLLDTRPADL